jgi:hypothetical protein
MRLGFRTNSLVKYFTKRCGTGVVVVVATTEDFVPDDWGLTEAGVVVVGTDTDVEVCVTGAPTVNVIEAGI